MPRSRGQLDGERRGRAHRDDSRQPGDARLLDELEAGAAAEAGDRRPAAASARRGACAPSALSIALCRPTSSRSTSSAAVGGSNSAVAWRPPVRSKPGWPPRAVPRQLEDQLRLDRRARRARRRFALDELERRLAADAAGRAHVEAALVGRVAPQARRVRTSTTFAARSSVGPIDSIVVAAADQPLAREEARRPAPRPRPGVRIATASGSPSTRISSGSSIATSSRIRSRPPPGASRSIHVERDVGIDRDRHPRESYSPAFTSSAARSPERTAPSM